jgi:hypothetical protein
MFSKSEENGCLLPSDILYDPQMAPMIRQTLLLHVHIKATITLKKEATRSKANSTVFRNPTLCQNPEVYHLVSTHCEELDSYRICTGALV